MADFTPITEVRAFLESGTTATARTNIGLGNVDNTTDLLKPISTATLAVTDAITARDWVQLADNEFLESEGPDVYTRGLIYFMRVGGTSGYPDSSMGMVVTESRGAASNSNVWQEFQSEDTAEVEE